MKRFTHRILPLLAALLLPALAPHAAAQTYLAHDKQLLTPSPAGPGQIGELSKDAMSVDNFGRVYSAGYQDSPAGGPPGRRGVVLVHTPVMVVVRKLISPQPDSVYTDVVAKSNGAVVWITGTRNVSGAAAEMFVERWAAPLWAGPTHTWLAGTLLGPGQTYGGKAHQYGANECVFSGCWTAGASKMFAVALKTFNLSPVPGFSTSVIPVPGVLGGLDSQRFRWGTDVFKWHPRAFLSVMNDGRFYLGGTIHGDIHVNRFHLWDGLPSVSFNGGPHKTWSHASPDLMTGMMGLPNSGVYVCGVSQNPSQGFLYSWTRGTSASAPSVTRAGASPYPFGPGSGIYDVKAQTVGSRTHIYAGGFAVALGGGFIWHFQHIGPAGAMTMPPPTEWPFMPYAAPGLPWVNDLPVYGLDVTRPYMTASGLAPGVVYGTGQHSLGGGPNGVSGQIAMKVESPGLPSWSLMPPFPASGTGRLVVGHTIRWAGPQIFSHGNGTLDSGGSYTSDGEVMSFTP